MIYKPMTWLASLNGEVLFTNIITETDLVHNAPSLAKAPGIFQEEIKKKYEYRITTIDETIFCVRIHSQRLEATKLDWRRDQTNVRYEVCSLPSTICDQILRVNAQLGLRDSAIDMIETPDDHFVFLEANPGGQWLWLEKKTGVPISKEIARRLCFHPIAATADPC